MAKGDPQVSPFVFEAQDYLGRALRVTVPFDDVTKNILDGTVVHRDDGCLWSTIVFADPSGPLRKGLPSAPVGDTTFTAQQVRIATGFRTYDDIMAAGQITAEV
jgi:hypothetical protein